MSRLAKVAGVNKNTLTALLGDGGREPQTGTLEKIASALGTTIADLNGAKAAKKEGLVWLQSIEELENWDQVTAQNLLDTSLDEAASRRALVVLDEHARLFGFTPGSVVIVDMERKAESGNLVVFQDHTGTLAIRYYAEPFMVAGPNGPIPYHEVADRDVALIGPVVAKVEGQY